MADNIPIFPVSGWDAGPVPSMGIMVIRFHFLAHPLQKLEEADPGRNYALTPPQLRELRDAIDRALVKLEKPEVPASTDRTN